MTQRTFVNYFCKKKTQVGRTKSTSLSHFLKKKEPETGTGSNKITE